MLNSVPLQMARLDEAVGAKDREEVSLRAHELKGTFATVGAEALAQGCQTLKVLAETADWAAVEIGSRAIRGRWEGLSREAGTYLEALTAQAMPPAP